MYCYIKNRYSRESSRTLLGNMLMIISFVCLLLLIVVLTTTGSKSEEYIEIRVENGQSLWNIATQYYNSEYDIRKKIYEIKKINNLENSLLHPGQKLKIPVK